LWLAVLLIILLLRYGWRRLHHWYRNRYRREAAARLRLLAQDNDSDTLLIELNKLLKLTALAAFSREQVASLSGHAWVNFLNRQCPSQPFSGDIGLLLATGVYETARQPQARQQALLAACRDWIEQHEGPLHV
jgi:hypothetical protein